MILLSSCHLNPCAAIISICSAWVLKKVVPFLFLFFSIVVSFSVYLFQNLLCCSMLFTFTAEYLFPSFVSDPPFVTWILGPLSSSCSEWEARAWSWSLCAPVNLLGSLLSCYGILVSKLCLSVFKWVRFTFFDLNVTHRQLHDYFI